MDLCVLPQTGANEQWLVLAVVAFVVIGAGVALAFSGKARRRVATGLGALAIVGALAIGGVHAAPAAQADAGASDCITPGGAAPAGDTVVTPQIPTASQQCLAEPTITVPSQAGIDFTSAREGDILTVSAAAQPGYRILEGATTSWQYVMTPPVPAASPVALPASVRAEAVETTDEANRFAPVDSNLVRELQAAQDAGTASYELDGSGAALAYTLDFVSVEDGSPLPSATVSRALGGGILQYDIVLDLYLFSTTLTDAEQDAINEELLAAAQAEAFSDESRQLVGVTLFIDGLAVNVAWGADTVCGPQVQQVAVDGILESETAPAPGDAPGASTDLAPFFADAAPAADSAPADAAPTAAPAAEEPVVEEPAVTEPEATEPEATEPEASEVPAPVEG